MGSLLNDYRAKKASEDQELYLRLAAALESGRIQILLDPQAVNFQGSPIYNPWDQLAPLLVLMSLSLITLLGFGLIPGLAFMTLAAIIQLWGVKYWVNHRVFERTKRYLMSGSAQLEYLWKLGAIGLTLKGELSVPCVSPQGDWRTFTRRALHLSQHLHGEVGGDMAQNPSDQPPNAP